MPAGISRRPYIPPANQYQALRNRRKVGYWRTGDGEDERGESANPRKMCIWGGEFPSGGVPSGSPRFRGGPLCVPSHCPSSSPLCSTPTILGVSKPPKRRVLGEWRRGGENERGQTPKTPRKRRISGGNDIVWISRRLCGGLTGPCSHSPFPPPYIPPPANTRRFETTETSGTGQREEARREREDPKRGNPGKKADAKAEWPPVGVHWGHVWAISQ